MIGLWEHITLVGLEATCPRPIISYPTCTLEVVLCSPKYPDPSTSPNCGYTFQAFSSFNKFSHVISQSNCRQLFLLPADWLSRLVVWFCFAYKENFFCINLLSKNFRNNSTKYTIEWFLGIWTAHDCNHKDHRWHFWKLHSSSFWPITCPKQRGFNWFMY